MPQGSPWSACAALLLLNAGCTDLPTSETDPPTPPPELGRRFDPSASGTLAGRILWRGPVPEVPSFRSPPSPISAPPRQPWQDWPNPNAPLIDTASGGLGDAVVFLRGIDPELSQPWDHRRVRVEHRECQMHIRQGKTATRVGFVRRGDPVDLMAFDNLNHMLRVRGADFFTLPLVEPQRVRSRTLEQNGLVELSSGAGRFWMRGDPFVDEHPYYARTNARGEFSLEQVPEGEYELVAWHPSWQVAEVSNDPGWNLASDLAFHPPVKRSLVVTVRRGQTERVEFELTAGDFAP